MSVPLRTRDALRALVEGLEMQLARLERDASSLEELARVGVARKRIEAAGNLADAYGRRGNVSRFQFSRTLEAIDDARALLASLERRRAA